jgi:hypothetical protein
VSDNALGSDFPEEDASPRSIDRLLLQSVYTPQELAELLDLPLTLIEHDAFAGRLPATIVEHNIIAIRREDAIAWLKRRA